jgi:hypothetical protein
LIVGTLRGRNAVDAEVAVSGVALEQFGRQGVIELALILGNYSMLALVINSLDTDLPPDRTEPLLPV